MSACCRSAGRPFYSFRPAAAKHLSPFSCCRIVSQHTSSMWQNAADISLLWFRSS